MFTSPIDLLFKVIVLGDSGVGKTSLVQMFLSQGFQESYKATIGADLHSKEIHVDGNSIFLQIWDTAGQERFKSVENKYFRGTDTCILVYDITNEESFLNLIEWKSIFLDQANVQDPSNFPFLLIGNKSDCEDERVISTEEGEKWAKENGCMAFIETSAKEFSNVNEAFDIVARNISDRINHDMNIIKERREKARAKIVLKDDEGKEEKDSGGCC